MDEKMFPRVIITICSVVIGLLLIELRTRDVASSPRSTDAAIIEPVAIDAAIVVPVVIETSQLAGNAPTDSTKTRPTLDEPRIRRITFGDIDLAQQLKSKHLSPKHVKQIPLRVTKLDGAHATIQGFMCPTLRETGLNQFMLMEELRL